MTNLTKAEQSQMLALMCRGKRVTIIDAVVPAAVSPHTGYIVPNVEEFGDAYLASGEDEDVVTERDGARGGLRRRRGVRRCGKCDDNYKPGRAHHDSVTGRCVVKMDHFCPWVGNAVGIMNHKVRYLVVSTVGRIEHFLLASSIVLSFYYVHALYICIHLHVA